MGLDHYSWRQTTMGFLFIFFQGGTYHVFSGFPTLTMCNFPHSVVEHIKLFSGFPTDGHPTVLRAF